MTTETTNIFVIRAIIEAIESGSTNNKIYLQKEIRGSLFFELNNLIKEKKKATSLVPIEKLNRLSKNGNHQHIFMGLNGHWLEPIITSEKWMQIFLTILRRGSFIQYMRK